MPSTDLSICWRINLKTYVLSATPINRFIRWRGADIGNILSFEKDYKNAEMIMLEQNYRSTKRILQAANDVITNNKSRYDKKLRTDNEEGESIYVYKASDEKDESQFVVGKIH